MRTLLTFVLLAVPSLALAQDEAPPKTWDEYQGAHSLVCNGPFESLPAPETRELGGYQYVFMGHTAKVRRVGGPAVKGEVRLGVLSGIKDAEGPTQALLDTFIAKFKEEQVEGIIVGGDSAEYESDLEAVFEYLGRQNLPTYVVIGNWESRAPFNRALRVASKEHPNLVNMDLVRRLDGEGFDLVTLAGYLDKAYVKTSGACVYKPEDVAALKPLLGSAGVPAGEPLVMLMHGPPRQTGKDAIDYVPGAGNVGDQDVAKLLKEAGINFGVHGHILEAGGKATDRAGKKQPEKKLVKQLFLNPGPANPLPWKLNDGGTSYGLAAVLTIKGDTAKYEVLKGPKPKD